MFQQRIAALLSALVLLSACGLNASSGPGTEPSAVAETAAQANAVLGPLPSTAPALPFDDNPDPNACGIPELWTSSEPAWISGYYEGTLVQPIVYLYDSHLRREVIGQIPSGSRIEISLSQSNPVLNYYRVRSLDVSPVQDGWAPAPFVSFEPVD